MPDPFLEKFVLHEFLLILRMQDQQKEDGMERDPVCGMSVDPEDAAATSQSQGKTYYFCSEECKETFEENPSQYVRKGA
jgi:Cu+-exporting ATPase